MTAMTAHQTSGDSPAIQIVHLVDTGKAGDAGKFGITGFCWGGSVVWLYAAH